MSLSDHVNADVRLAVKASRVGSAVTFAAKHRLFIERRRHRLLRSFDNATSDADPYGLSDYRGTHVGETCIVVGNGPSVTPCDLDAVMDSGIPSFGANRVSDLFESSRWRPTYLCAMEHGFLNKADGREGIAEFVRSLDGTGVGHVFLNEEHIPGMGGYKSNLVSFVRCPLSPLYSTCLMPFSDDARSYVADLGSVTHFSIQLACFMGFATIYLLGVDNTYRKYMGLDGMFHVENERPSHAAGISAVADDTAAERVPRSAFEAYRMGGFADMRKADIGYLMCKEWAAAHDVKIYNATRGGALEVFERVDLDEVLELFKEGS